MVDLFKGEQQKNVDFAFLQALKTTGVDARQQVTLIYDIACQYSVHLKERIGHLLPAGLVVDAAIGLFHVHAHKDECFFRFAPSFIPGLGIICGEILESLWSALNKISSSVRTAHLSHRAEMLDDHASDSNHKKTLGIAFALCKAYEDASAMATQTKEYFQGLNNSAGLAAIGWERAIQVAEATRLSNRSAMDIYSAHCETNAGAGAGSASPTTCHPRQLSPVEQWIEFTLLVEERQ